MRYEHPSAHPGMQKTQGVGLARKSPSWPKFHTIHLVGPPALFQAVAFLLPQLFGLSRESPPHSLDLNIRVAGGSLPLSESLPPAQDAFDEIGKLLLAGTGDCLVGSFPQKRGYGSDLFVGPTGVLFLQLFEMELIKAAVLLPHLSSAFLLLNRLCLPPEQLLGKLSLLWLQS